MKDANYTPSIERLRTHYEWAGAARQDPAEFDRAIAKLQLDAIRDYQARSAAPTIQIEFTNQPEFEQVKRQAQADALLAVAAKMRDRFTAAWIRREAYKLTNPKETGNPHD